MTAFYMINWLTALEAYSFGFRSLNLMHRYITNRLQWFKVNGTYSSWKRAEYAVLQGSAFGPLLFNLVINIFIYFMKNSEVCSFADDTSIYIFDDSIETI